MTPEIEKRIKLVQAGKVPSGYKLSKVGVIPNEWSLTYLKDVAIHVTEKNKDNAISLTLTNSATKGVIKQTEYFDKQISNKENTDGYFVVQNGDYIYNPRISESAPCGPINRSHLGESGIASPLYTVFRMNSVIHNECYIEMFLKSPFWHRYMCGVANYGARHDRMNITNDDLFSMPLPVPPKREQEKIAEILAAQDRVIEFKEKLIAEKQKQKKILVRYLLSTEQKTRRQFALGNIKINKGKWNRVQLNSLLEFKNGVNVDKDKFGSGVKMISVMDILSGKPINYDSIRGSVELSQEELSVYAVDYGDILFQRSSENYEDAGSSNVYLDKNRRATFSGFVIRGKKISEYEPYCLNAILKIPEVRQSIMRKAAGAQHVNIGQEALASIQINLPSLPEQQAIAKVLSAADEEISLLQKDLEQEKLKKKSLMQLLLTGLVRVSA